MSEKLFDDDEFYMERFPCECLSPYHCLDVHLELADDGKRVVECGLDLVVLGKAPFWFRIKEAFKYLMGKDTTIVDYYLRFEDIPRFVAVLQRAIKTNYTDSN